jgi:hypothetical protein
MRILTADDTAIIRDGLARLLQGERLGVYRGAVDGSDRRRPP